jgi:O-antigen/teichoic acid export membrane protein
LKDTWKKLFKKIEPQKGLMSIGLGDVLGSGLSAFFWFYIAAILTPESYGEIHYLISIAGIAQLFSLIGNSSVLTVYSAKKVNIQSTLYILSIIPTVISSIVIFILLQRLDVSTLLFGYIIFESVNSVLLGRRLFSKYSKLVILQKALTLSLGVGFYFMFGPEGILFGLSCSFIPYIYFFMKEFRINKINFSLLKTRSGFISNNYFNTLAGGFGGQIDKLIIAPILGFALLGNYSLALQFISVMMIFSSIVFKFILPLDSAGKDTKRIKKYTIILSLIITILGITLSPIIIPELFPEYVETIIAVQILSISVFFGNLISIFSSKLLSEEKSKSILIANIISVGIIIIGFILLGPILGIVGLSMVHVVALAIESMILMLSTKRRNNDERR